MTRKETELRRTLASLAGNLLWCWKPWYESFLNSIDPEHFERWENPVKLVRELSDRRLKQLAADGDFREALSTTLARVELELADARERCPQELRERTIAYFSAEFGIHVSLPIYSGGLGILSGDHIKSAHDLGLPFVGVGLFYRQGYFIQRIDARGRQDAEMTLVDVDDLPLELVKDDKGRALEVSVELPERDVWLQVWECRVGNSRLLLLDSDTERNAPEDRSLTWQLYGGDRDTRMAQEIILGIGGVRILRALDIAPDVWHMNEGHSAFLAVERVVGLLKQGLEFDEAVEAVAANTVFTTHTPVPAGNEAFMLPRLHRYFHPYCDRNSVDFYRLLEMGTLKDKTGYKEFSLTALALRLSRFANGVSQLHGEVSRNMWYHLWHQVPIAETPIGHVTNGIHTASWVGDDFRELFESRVGPDWEQKLLDPPAWEVLREVDDAEIWRRHQKLKEAMVEEIRPNVTQRLAGQGTVLDRILGRLDPRALYICFARRFATYKRATLIFDDFDRLDRILNNASHPVCLVFAGKAHPADVPGQQLISRLHEISQMERFHGRVVLLDGYSIRLARSLVQGADVWLNNPRRPLEASGTSGQKVCPNAGLNFSVLDGWWVEGYNGGNGWRIGRDFDYGDDRIQDYYDVRSLYLTLEDEIVPMYFDRDERQVPREWVSRMKESLVTLTARFSTARMVNDYVEGYYIPAVVKGLEAREAEWKAVRQLIDYKHSLLDYWYHMTDTFVNARRDNESVGIEAGVYLGLLNPEDVKVELFMRTGERIRTVEFDLDGPADEDGVWRYKLDYRDREIRRSELKVRVLPRHEYLDHEMEMGICYWFHQKIE